jgi:hypothetical protein
MAPRQSRECELRCEALSNWGSSLVLFISKLEKESMAPNFRFYFRFNYLEY